MDAKKHDTIQKNKIDAGKIVLKSTNPKLSNRITTNITDPCGAVYWYIRFNVPLEAGSVSRHTMNITDTNGYILNSIITYDESRNLIVLNPMDLYRKNEYYILNISKDVRSAKGRALGKSMHILFKLVNNEISEFEILQATAAPKPRKKPSSLKRVELQELLSSKTYTAAVDINKNVGRPTLPYRPLGVKIYWAVIGLGLMIGSILSQDTALIIIAMVLASFGVVHIVIQLRKRDVKSAIAYTVGVARFNNGKYKKAQRAFIKAAKQDPSNEFAEYAANKVQYFL